MPSAEFDAGSDYEIEKRLARARCGETSQVGALLDLYRGYLLATAANSLNADISVKVAPSDLVQETFLLAIRGFPHFQGTSEAEFRNWLLEILTNKLVDLHRLYAGTAKRDVSREVPIESGLVGGKELAAVTDSPSAIASTAENVQMFQNAMQKLSEEQRLVIQLRNIDQVDFEEVGRRLGKTPDAARKFWSRAVKKLATELGINQG